MGIKKLILTVLILSANGCISIGSDGPLPNVEGVSISDQCVDLRGSYAITPRSCTWNPKRSGFSYRPPRFFTQRVPHDSLAYDESYAAWPSEITINQSKCNSIEIVYDSDKEFEHRIMMASSDLFNGEHLQWDEERLMMVRSLSKTGCGIFCGWEKNTVFVEISKDEEDELHYRSGLRELGLIFFLFPYGQDHIIDCELKRSK